MGELNRRAPVKIAKRAADGEAHIAFTAQTWLARASLGFAFALVQSAIVLIVLTVFGTDNRRPVSMATIVLANAVTTGLVSPMLFVLAQRLRQGGISRSPTEGAT